MVKYLKAKLLIALFVLVSLPPFVHANDTMAAIAAGGLQFQKTEDISMEEEYLFISLDKIKVRYLFKNHSDKDITTTVAFPVPEYDFKIDEILSRYPSDFNDFTVRVNGEEVQHDTTVEALVNGHNYAAELERMGVSVTDFGDYEPGKRANHVDDLDRLERGDRARLQLLSVIGGPEFDWPQWTVRVIYYWNQVFPAGEIMEIEHSYSPYYGGHWVEWGKVENSFRACLNQEDYFWLKRRWPAEKGGTQKYIRYVLTTGNNWKGSIGRFTLEVEQPDGMIATTCFSETSRLDARSRKTISMSNFTPTQDLTVYFFKPPAPPPPTTTIGTEKVDTAFGPHTRFPSSSDGPVSFPDERKGKKGEEGTFWRVTTTVEEIYATIYFEKLSVGADGCCETRLSLKMFNKWDFAKYYYLLGEFTDFSVTGWVSPTSFTAVSMGRTFLFSDIHNEKVTVTRISEKAEYELKTVDSEDETILQGDSRERVRKAIGDIR